ncbi:flagellar P-ring protein precursor FlgI [Hydrogenispora ethanolica]|jgi:flagellar P-ring protein precursor FlgI|uniref:Flagellar P-ring protein n=1 Tax=Hydrogenispora ethanolica TaxID=1082276 RepID=A0A4R1S9R2_HYDET|nr:flagellar basal body P-ring protein FlgI [Hydrogenispora ethanolica]TCL75272.1 flagellar P-ring protein precursor FlgI [Hydrogenispora ethanolica]
MLKKLIGLIFTAMILGTGLFPALAAAEENPVIITRIKDIARLEGVRSNQLTGMGLVVGLNGTGDSSKSNAQLVANTVLKWGIQLSVSDLKVKNIAAVFLTATLPPYTRSGDSLTVQVASFGDAKSLQGGVLLQSPLTGADGKVYAVAQGPVYLGGYLAGTKGASQQKNVTTVGVIPSGAIVERIVPMAFSVQGKLRWVLSNPDFTTATRLAGTINDMLNSTTARAVDMGMVEVDIPEERTQDPVAFISEIENLPVTPDGLAKVIINERTGTVIVGDKVKIAPVAVTHRNITVKITATPKVSQPNPLSGGQTQVVQEKAVEVNEEQGRLILMPAGTNIGTIVRSLNAVGTTPQDIIAVIVAIKEAGALYGTLEFM